ncbi:MAG: site-specific integrase [Ghiorsea sp.]
MLLSQWQFLQRSNQYIYYYRRAIPQALRPSFNNKWEIKKSLKTRDKSEAILRHNALNIQVEKMFNDVLKGMDQMAELTSPKYKVDLKKETLAIHHEGEAKAVYSGIIEELRGERLTLEDGEAFESAPIKMNDEGTKLLRLDGSEVDEISIVSALAYADSVGIERVIDETSFLPSGIEASVSWQDSTDQQRESFKVNRERELKRRGLTSKEVDAAMAAYSDNVDQVSQSTINSAQGLIPIKFSEMAEAYLALSGIGHKAEKSYLSKYKTFIDVCGDVISTDITRIMVTNYRATLCQIPRNAQQRHPNKSLNELVQMDTDESNRLAPKTVNTYITRLSTLFNWAVDQSYMSENVTPSIKLKSKKKAVAPEKPFETEELQQYFIESPVHRDRNTKGRKLELFWFPLIALYSGMRIEEIAELFVRDVKEIEDNRTGEKVWCFDVNADGFAKSRKNDPSERYVAIHSELIKIGILQHFEARKKKKFETLWNLTPKTEKGRYSALFGTRHATYIHNTVGIRSRSKTFHSFRHTVIKALREAPDVREDYMKALVGHGLRDTIGKDYFSKLGVTMLKSTVEGIKYPRLDLSHLYQMTNHKQ